MVFDLNLLLLKSNLKRLLKIIQQKVRGKIDAYGIV